MSVEHGMPLPMHAGTVVPASHWKLLPTSGVAVTRVETVLLKGNRNETPHPVHGTGSLPGTKSLPCPLPEAEKFSVRARMNFLWTARLVVMSTKHTEPLWREQPVHPTNMLSVPKNGMSATTV